MKYVVCEINMDENSVFGAIPVLDTVMERNLCMAEKLFKDVAISDYGVDKSDARIKVVDEGSITYSLVVRYGEFDHDNFRTASRYLADCFAPCLIDENRTAALYALMKHVQ